MNVVQVWLLIALPALVVGLSMFIGHSVWRAAVGYMVLTAGFGAVAAFDRGSAAVFGIALALLYAAGRGGVTDATDLHLEDTGVPKVVHKHGRPLSS